MTSNAELLADRYGRRLKTSPPKRRSWFIALGLIAALLFSFWALSSINAPNNSVAVVSSVSKPVGESGFKISGTISRPKNGVVRCALQVQALDFSIVGYREITLASGVDSFDQTVYSVSKGVSASVARCWMQ